MQKKVILSIYGLFAILGLSFAIFGALILVLPLTKTDYLLPGWAIADCLIGGLFFFFAGSYGYVSQTSDASEDCKAAVKMNQKKAIVDTMNSEEKNHDAKYWLQKFLDENQGK
jgi:hypothetical protein